MPVEIVGQNNQGRSTMVSCALSLGNETSPDCRGAALSEVGGGSIAIPGTDFTTVRATVSSGGNPLTAVR